MSWWNPIDDIKAVVHAVTHPVETVEDAWDFVKDEVVGALKDPQCVGLKLNPAFWGGVLAAKAAYQAGLIKSKDDIKNYVGDIPLEGIAIDCLWKEVSEGSTENAIAHATALGVAASQLTTRVIALYVTPVSRSKDKLDIFSVAAGGQVRTAAWEPEFTDWWHGWWHVAGGQAARGSHVGAVSRSQDKLDIFVTGTDNRVWTAAWEQGRDTAWRGWWPIGDLIVPVGAPVTAVSRSPDMLDIFVVGANRKIYTAAWEQGRDTAWQGWWSILIDDEIKNEDIATRAYYLFEQRGRQHGDDLKDWLRAEDELLRGQE